MSALVILLPLALLPGVYAVLVKLAAFLLRQTQLSWKHALLFGLIALLVAAIGALANRAAGQVLPALFVGLVGIAVQLVLGGWYFGPRARTASGEPVGFSRGMLLSLVAFGIVFAVGVALAVLVPALQNASQP
jgi:hypothetical protein